MHSNLAAFPARSARVRLFAWAAAAAVTVVIFEGVVALADDQPMAIAGQGLRPMLAQKAPAKQPAALVAQVSASAHNGAQ
jgi:hypothetical protein